MPLPPPPEALCFLADSFDCLFLCLLFDWWIAAKIHSYILNWIILYPFHFTLKLTRTSSSFSPSFDVYYTCIYFILWWMFKRRTRYIFIHTTYPTHLVGNLLWNAIIKRKMNTKDGKIQTYFYLIFSSVVENYLQHDEFGYFFSLVRKQPEHRWKNILILYSLSHTHTHMYTKGIMASQTLDIARQELYGLQ